MKLFLAIFYVVLVLTIYAFYYACNKKTCKIEGDRVVSQVKNNITPVSVFSIAFMVYSSLGLFERATDQDEDFFKVFVFFLANFLGFVFFLIGYGTDKSILKKLSLRSFFKRNVSNKRKLKIGGAVVAALFIVFALLNLSTVTQMISGFGTGNSYVEYSIREERTALSGVMQAFRSYFFVFMLLFPFYRCYTKQKIGLIDIAIVAVIFSWSLFSGDRTNLVAILLMAAIIINERIKTISMKFIVLAVIFALFSLVLLGHLRRYNSITDMLNMLRTSDLSSLLSLKGVGEFKNTTGTLFNYIKRNESITDFGCFEIYFRELLVWIPTVLFPARPLPWAEQYMLDFFPNAPAGTGHGWYILTDGYMAFGLFGVAMEMLLYGALIKLVYTKFFEKKTDGVIAFLYAYFLLYVFYSVRSSAMLTIKNYIIAVLPVVLIYFIFKKFFRTDMGVK